MSVSVSTAETLLTVCAVRSWRLCFPCFCISRTRLHLRRSGENCRTCRISAAYEMWVFYFRFLVFGYVKVKATLLQLEVLESGIEERLNAPPVPCLSCADWFLPSATSRDSLASASPVFTKLAGAVKGSRGRGLFGDRTRRCSPQRSLSDSGSEGQGEGGWGSTPESPRKLGGRRDSVGSDSSGGLFKVDVSIPGATVQHVFFFTLKLYCSV